MWISKKMSDDFDNKITWIPMANNFHVTLDAVIDALNEAGYIVTINKGQ